MVERRTAGEQQLNRTRSSNCGCEEERLQVVTPRSFPSSHSDEASVDTCAPRADVATTAAQESLNPRVRPSKVDRVTTNPDKTRHLLSESRTVRRIDVRWICQAKRKVNFNDFQRTLLDSHADTCCAGSNMAMLELTGDSRRLIESLLTMARREQRATDMLCEFRKFRQLYTIPLVLVWLCAYCCFLYSYVLLLLRMTTSQTIVSLSISIVTCSP